MFEHIKNEKPPAGPRCGRYSRQPYDNSNIPVVVALMDLGSILKLELE
jgi:hypothetical protein